MKKIITTAYEADDGKVFNTEEECIDYEGSHGTAEFYDCNGEHYPALELNPTSFDIWDYDFGHCQAIHVTSSRCTIKDNSEFKTLEKGWYFFDYEHDDWFKVPDTYAKWIQP